ncbi:SWIM zinc finger family protein [Georgenia sp. SUBG003]|uniref:SWIM zinc finger family protein n=1 Tax=Georgenia sp. SUBG003 TaxID=1497974 RepID=UPI003AB4C051
MARRPALATLRTWPDLPGEDQILLAVGPQAFARGIGYARSGKVSWLTSDPERRVLYAEVQGTDAHPYQTLVQVGDAHGARLSTGRCTCPVAVDCKHVAAVLVAARDELTPLSRTARPWERLLADVVEDERTDGGDVPIGLQLEPVVEPGWRGEPATLRLRLRPVVPGKKSPWVRTGIGWRDLSFRWGAHGRVEAHREALHAIWMAHQPSAYSYNDTAVHLDEFGPAVWPLLRAAVDAGVPLVLARPSDGASSSRTPRQRFPSSSRGGTTAESWPSRSSTSLVTRSPHRAQGRRPLRRGPASSAGPRTRTRPPSRWSPSRSRCGPRPGAPPLPKRWERRGRPRRAGLRDHEGRRRSRRLRRRPRPGPARAAADDQGVQPARGGRAGGAGGGRRPLPRRVLPDAAPPRDGALVRRVRRAAHRGRSAARADTDVRA